MHICNNQNDFEQGRFYKTQLLLTINDLISKNLDNNLQTDVTFLDFTKVFDKVDHSCLIHKLESYSIQESLLFWLENFLNSKNS